MMLTHPVCYPDFAALVNPRRQASCISPCRSIMACSPSLLIPARQAGYSSPKP